MISSCFDFRGLRNKVVMVELEFPSIQYFYHEQRRLGARVELVPTLDDIRIDLDKLLAAIDETTLLVPISQVLFRSSCIVDARAIIERAHRVGAYVILDVFQAAGSIPLDVYACQPGLEILNKVGISAIRDKSVRMTARLIEGARSRGWRVNSPENPAERAGTVSVECPHAQEVCRELLARDIIVDYRPKAGVRVSPHFYNSEDECNFTLAQMQEILNTGAWEKHAAAATHA